MQTTTNNPDGEWLLRFGGGTLKITGPLSDAPLTAAEKAFAFREVRIDDIFGGPSFFIRA
jgi:hypothetical protein